MRRALLIISSKMKVEEKGQEKRKKERMLGAFGTLLDHDDTM